jgi:superfamily II DNA/RNA helicase
LDILEAPGSDSKAATLVTLLEHINGVKTSSTRVCVLTEFVATLFYLAAEIESRGQTCQVFHGGMPAEERQRTLSLFASEGGVLVATRGVVSGSVSLGEVTDLVLYDTPGGLAALQSVLGRVDRFGRTTQLNIQVLVPSNDVAGGDIESLELLRRMVNTPGSEQAGNLSEEG